MATVDDQKTLEQEPVSDVPPLENGDSLTQPEFHRRCLAMPENIKAELINGIVYMSPPVTSRGHARPHSRIGGWLWAYLAGTPGVELLDNATVIPSPSDESADEVQPDCALMIPADKGGQATISDDDYVHGAPEFICEISSSSASIDRHSKFKLYEKHGVQEYLIWRVRDRQFDWFTRREGRLQQVQQPEDGVHRSTVFPGLWLNVPQMLIDNMQGVMNTLTEGLQIAAHREFVARLQKDD